MPNLKSSSNRIAKKFSKNRTNGKRIFTKKNVSLIIIFISILTVILVSFFMKVKKTNNNYSFISRENLRAMNYEEFIEGDEKVYVSNTQGTDSEQIVDNVKFSTFFLRDLDGDGYAEKLKGTCKEIGKEDTLYMEIIVQTAGYLKDGKIQINGNNFYLQTALPKDNELKANYIGNNIKTIEFENLNNGTQKLITGIVRSGDYTYNSQKTSAIGNNINNYSRQDNKVILTGTYVDENGNEIEIRKEVNLEMDWYGTAKASFGRISQNSYNILNRIDEEKGTLTLDFFVNSEETKKALNISYNYLEGTIPNLNGYEPISVKLLSGTGEFTYDESTRKFVIRRNAITNEDGEITTSVANSLYNTIEVIYPLEAYNKNGTEMVTIKVPVSTYYEGYNNPNDEFDNPYKSNNATSTIIANYMPVKGTAANFEIKVGKKSSNPLYSYMISKRKPLKIYNGTSSEEKDDTYLVMWRVNTGTNVEESKLILKETKDGEIAKVDTFVKKDSTEDTMEELTSNVGIYFSNADNILGKDGEIKVYDEETGILLHTFTSKEWNKYTGRNPYKYETAVKHIKIETSIANKDSVLYVYNIKELDDNKIIEKYAKEDFDNLTYIKSNLTVYLGENCLGSTMHQAYYEEPYSLAKISLSKSVLSTQLTEKSMKIRIETIADTENNQIEWTNGNFLIKLPDEILKTKINDVNISNTEVMVDSYEYIENANGKFIRIKTSNINPISFTITIDVDITPDPRKASTTKNVTLYAKNEDGVSYGYSGADIYDLDSNGNVEENVNVVSTILRMIAPNSLLTNQTMSEYDNNGTLIISPQIAELKPIYSDVDRDKQTVRIGAQLKNNYSSTISEVKIVGKIPFEGNTYVLSNNNLNSEFTTEMKNTGIEVPEELQNKVAVYYSTNENPTKDLTNENNRWTTKENVTNWSEVKTWLIDFGDTIIEQGKEFVFYYTIEIPFGVEFNKIAYSHHGIYFSLDTSEGKYKTQTEPNKIGVMIADKYNLLLTKFQKNAPKKIEGAIYKVSELDDDGNIEESQTAITNAEGLLEMANLYAERVYEIKEIQSPNDYELNDDIVKILGHIDRHTGVLEVEKLEGTIKDGIQITKNEGEDYKTKIQVEDEVKAKIKLIKFEEGTNITISGVRYKITGYGLPENGKNITTNTNGEIDVSGIKIGEEYSLIETKAKEGYYLNEEQIKFIINNNNGTYEVNIVEGTVKSSTVSISDGIPTISIEIENEKIPTYNLRINKVEKGSITEDNNIGIPVVGAKFKLFKGEKTIGIYTTDSQGYFDINGLYLYEAEKDIEQTYTLKEIYAPEGYTETRDLTFTVSEVMGIINYQEKLGDNEEPRDYNIDGTTVIVTIEDNPSFKLIKQDGETNELLPNVKFAIYNVEEAEKPARNSKGEIIGEKEIINGKEYYTVTTNENGEITADLPEGIYKAVEVGANEKYDIEEKSEYFGVGTSSEGQIIYKKGWQDRIYLSSPSTFSGNLKSVSKTEDGGFVVGGYYYARVDLGDYIFENSSSNQRSLSDGIIIKYSKENEVEWATSINSSLEDKINSVYGTSDGGFIVGGEFGRNGILKKYNREGIEEWQKTIGGAENSTKITSVKETSDGGYIAIAFTTETNLTIGDVEVETEYNYNTIIIKYSAEREVDWVRSVESSNIYDITSVTELEDGSYLVGGYFCDNVKIGEYTLTSNGYSDGILIKYSSLGEIEWVKKVENVGSVEITSIAETKDGGFVVVGDYSGNNIEVGDYTLITKGSRDGLIVKYSDTGEVEWARNIWEKNKDSISPSVFITSDGGIIFGCGYTKSDTQSRYYNGVLVKYNMEGTEEWRCSVDSSINCISETEDKGIVVTGEESNLTVDVIKYNAQKYSKVNIENVKSVGGEKYEQIETICNTSDGGCIVGGSFYSNNIQVDDYTFTNSNSRCTDILIVKYDSEEKVEWATSIGGDNNEYITDVKETVDGGYIAIGQFSSANIQIGDFELTNSNKSEDGSRSSCLMIIKYSSDGNVEYAQSYNCWSATLNMTEDGGFIIGGSYLDNEVEIGEYICKNEGDTDSILIKYSIDGKVEWVSSIGGIREENINSVCTTSDGGYIVTGKSYSPTIKIGNDIFSYSEYREYKGYSVIVKYDINNEVKWIKMTDKILNMAKTTQDGKIIAISDHDLIVYNQEGEEESTVKISPTINSINITQDGGFILGGYYSNKEKLEGYEFESKDKYSGIIIKYNENGKIDWATSIEGEDNVKINKVCETEDGKIFAGGSFENNILGLGKYSLENKGSNDGLLVKLGIRKAAPEYEELTIKNYRKEYKITTDINRIDGIKGGTISGEGLDSYEKIKYGDTNTKEIKIIPDENYEIIGITVNGNNHQFVELSDGSYIMPQFENITENKYIVATFALKDNKITINKKDSVSKDEISGVEFKLDQIEERTNPENSEIIGTLTNNGQEYTEFFLGNEVTTGIGEIINNGEYYFVQQDGKYIPTNGKSYQLLQGETVGVSNTTANSYIPIDLSSMSGNYVIVVNASCSSENNWDSGYATITNNITAPKYNLTTGRFMYISGTKDNLDYQSSILAGGKKYYLHLGYRKDGGGDIGEDQVIINSIKLYLMDENSVYYNFIDKAGIYESTNQGKNNTVCNSYIPINLEGYTGKYNITVNAEISTQGYDYGYVTLNQSTEAPTYNSNTTTNRRFVYISSTQSAKDYTIEVDGGYRYYLHMGYRKDATTNTDGEDLFTINSINISLSDSELYHTIVTTNIEGKAITQIPFGKYQITEINTNEKYLLDVIPTVKDNENNVINEEGIIEFRSGDNSQHEFTIENEKLGFVKVHHYLKGTTEEIAETDEISGKVGDNYYTSPKLNIKNYSIEEDNNGNYIVPENAVGTFTYNDIDVNYYYDEVGIPIKVNYYIEGTNELVPLKEGGYAESVTIIGKENEEYNTVPLDEKLLANGYILSIVPENASGICKSSIEVNYYYRLEEFKITTDIIEHEEENENYILENIKGGTISGEDENPYEIVKYGDSSTKEIKIVPDEVHKIKRITINGENIDFTPEEDNTVTLNKFENIIENKNIVVEFERIPTKVIVHHYIEGTTNKITLKDGSIAEDEIYDKHINEIYNTSPIRDDNLDIFYFVNSVGETSGLAKNSIIEIIYYYKYKTYNLEITKYEYGTNRTLSGVEFELINNITEETYECITDNDGIIGLTLNQGESYSLKEIKTNDGYIIKENEIKFKTQYEENTLVFKILEGEFKETEEEIDATLTNMDNPSFAVSIENEGIFTLNKTGSHNHSALSGAKFIIKEIVDEANGIEEDAQDIYGNVVGEVEQIDGEEVRIVTTDGKGKISIPLKPGKYKVTEVQAPEYYELGNDNTYYFEIEENEEDIAEINKIYDGNLLLGNMYGPSMMAGSSIIKHNNNYIVIGALHDSSITIPAEQMANGEERVIEPIGQADGLIYYYNEQGLIEDIKQIGIAGGYSGIYGIANTQDGGYVVCGEITGDVTIVDGELEITQSGNYNDEAIVIKYDSNGKAEWINKVAPNSSSGYTRNNYITETLTGKIVVAGNNDFGTAVIPAESTVSNQEIVIPEGPYVMQLNQQGKVEWVTALSEYNLYADMITIIELNNGNYAIDMLGNNGNYIEISSVDGSIATQNMEILSELHNIIDFSNMDIGYGALTSDKGVALVGTVYNETTIAGEYTVNGEDITLVPQNENGNSFIFKFNNEGKVEWYHLLESTNENYLYGFLINRDGNIITLGEYTGSLLIKAEDTLKETELNFETQENKYNLIILKYDVNGKVVYGNGNEVLQETQSIMGLSKISNNAYMLMSEIYDDRTQNYEYKTEIFEESYKEGKIAPQVLLNIENNVQDITKELSYTVEYYKDGVLQEDDTQTETLEVHILDGDTLEVDQSKINVENKYEGYEFKESDPERIPTIAVDGEVIKIYYVAKIGKVTINHIDKNNSTNILETEQKEVKYGETLETSEKDFDGYILVEKPDVEEYTYSENEQIVNYYYAKLSTGVLEKHLNVITGDPVADSKSYEGYEGKPYTTSEKEIEGYKIATNKEYYEMIARENENFLSNNEVSSVEEYLEKENIVGNDNYVPENKAGTMTAGLIEVKYYYIPKVKLTVKYIDILTGEELKEEVEGELVDSTINKVGEVDEAYETEAKEFDKYLKVSNKSYYKLFLLTHPEVLEEENVNTLEEYLEKKNIDPKAEYVPDNKEGNLRIMLNDDGTYSDEIVVIYYYGPEREVLVKYYDKVTGEEIAEEVVKVGPDGDPYSVAEEKKEIEGYTLVQEPTDPEGVYEETNEPRKFYYAKNTKVIVKYVDKDTNTVIDSSKNYNIEGYEGKEYRAEKKNFESYSYVEDSNNTEGTMSRDGIQVIYYYKKSVTPSQGDTPGNTTNTNTTNNTTNNTSTNTTSNNTNTTNTVTNTSIPNTNINTVTPNNNISTNNSESTTQILELPKQEDTIRVNTIKTSNNEPSNYTKNIVARVINPKTGDIVPTVTYTVIIITLIINVILAEKNSAKVSKANKVSRIEKTKEIKRWMEISKSNKKEKRVTSKGKGRRSK